MHKKRIGERDIDEELERDWREIRERLKRDRDEELYTIDEELERLSRGLAGHQLHHHHWDPTSNTGYRSSRNTNTSSDYLLLYE